MVVNEETVDLFLKSEEKIIAKRINHYNICYKNQHNFPKSTRIPAGTKTLLERCNNVVLNVVLTLLTTLGSESFFNVIFVTLFKRYQATL